MLQTCFGIYIVIALLTFLVFWGTLVETQQHNEETKEEE